MVPISFFVDCESESEVDHLFSKLSEVCTRTLLRPAIEWRQRRNDENGGPP
jgi:hypothetical protein